MTSFQSDEVKDSKAPRGIHKHFTVEKKNRSINSKSIYDNEKNLQLTLVNVY